MTYDEMKKKYPNKEIKLIPAEYEAKYQAWGFITIETCTQSAFNKNYNYCFMIVKEV
jgi:hypothetical protein